MLIHRKLSVSNNCAVAVKNANQMAGTHIQNGDAQGRTHCCTTVQSTVRSHLEYCSLVWSPYLKKDILSIAKVQRRVTNIISFISALTYEELLNRSGLISLESNRLRADLLEVFKFLHATCYTLQYERQKIQRTHAETREAKGKVGTNTTPLTQKLTRRIPYPVTWLNQHQPTCSRLPYNDYLVERSTVGNNFLPLERGHLTT